MKKVQFTCSELTGRSRKPKGMSCYTFTPSLRLSKEEAESLTEEEYADYMSMCQGLRDDEEAFREAGCKRRAHLMIPQGRRSGARGFAEVVQPHESGMLFSQRLRKRPATTALGARTQSLSARPGERAETAVSERKQQKLEAYQLRLKAIKDALVQRASENKVRLNGRELDRGVPEDLSMADPSRMKRLRKVITGRASRTFLVDKSQSLLSETLIDTAFLAQITQKLTALNMPSLRWTDPFNENSRALWFSREQNENFPPAVNSQLNNPRNAQVIQVGSRPLEGEPVQEWIDLVEPLSALNAQFRQALASAGTSSADRLQVTVAFNNKAFGILRRALAKNRGDIYVLRLTARSARGKVYDLDLPGHSLQHSIHGGAAGKASRPDYAAFTSLSVDDLALFLAGASPAPSGDQPREYKSRRGRYLSSVR